VLAAPQPVAADGPLRGPPLNRSVRPHERPPAHRRGPTDDASRRHVHSLGARAPTTRRRPAPMKKGPIAGQQLSFHAVLENWAEGMNYCAVPVPAAITAALGTTGPVLVLARVNESAPFQVSLFPVGNGQHYLRIKATVRQETQTTTGDRIRLRRGRAGFAASAAMPDSY